MHVHSWTGSVSMHIQPVKSDTEEGKASIHSQFKDRVILQKCVPQTQLVHMKLLVLCTGTSIFTERL